MAEEVSPVSSCEMTSESEKISENAKSDALVTDLSQDYAKYLKVNVTAEVCLFFL